MNERNCTWKVIIDDGFSAYEYTFGEASEDVSIHEISEIVRLFVHAGRTSHRMVEKDDK